jgi:cbb3-type cytochrome oxidase subunit 3
MISICLFVAVFIGVLIWAFTRRAEFIDTMSSLPLEDGEKISNRKKSL